MPAVATLEELEQAVRDADASAFGLMVEPEALAAARRSVDESGLLLLPPPSSRRDPDTSTSGSPGPPRLSCRSDRSRVV